MIRSVLQSISGVELFPLVSLVLFFLSFLGVTIWALRLDKQHVRRMSELPLHADPESGDRNHD